MSRKHHRSAIILSIYLLLQAGCKTEAADGVRDTAQGLSALCALPGFLGVALSPTGAGIVAGGVVVQGVSLLVLGVIELLPEANQAPDSDFGSPAVVIPVHFRAPFVRKPILLDLPRLPGYPVSNDLSISTMGDRYFTPASVLRSFVVAGKLVDDSRLLRSSLRKYYGAVNARDMAAAQLQKGGACRSLNDFNGDLQAYSDALLAISADAQDPEFAMLSTTVGAVLAQRNEIIQSGHFPDSEQFVFTQAAATPEELSGALNEEAAVTGQSLTDADLKGAVIFSRAARQIDHTDASAFLPTGFSCTDTPVASVPTLSNWGGLTMTVVLLIAGILAIWRRAAP